MNFAVKFLEIARAVMIGVSVPQDVNQHGEFAVEVTDAIKAKIPSEFTTAQVGVEIEGNRVLVKGDKSAFETGDALAVEFHIKNNRRLQFVGSKKG